MIEALVCMATAIYFEARGEPTVGQIAVGQVIMSRVADHRYPDSVCDVVKEGYYYSWNPSIPIPDNASFHFGVTANPKKLQIKKLMLGQKKFLGGCLREI